MKEDHIDLPNIISLVMIRIYQIREVSMQIVPASRGQCVNVMWQLGSVILVPRKSSDLKVCGTGRLVCHAFEFVQTQDVWQR